MTIDDLRSQTIAMLGANYRQDDENLLGDILANVIDDCLRISNRQFKPNREAQLEVLKSNIIKATTMIYLRRGVEEVNNSSQSGVSNQYADIMETTLNDIIRQNKRVLL